MATRSSLGRLGGRLSMTVHPCRLARERSQAGVLRAGHQDGGDAEIADRHRRRAADSHRLCMDSRRR